MKPLKQPHRHLSLASLRALTVPVSLSVLALGSVLLMGCPFAPEETVSDGMGDKQHESLDELLNDDILKETNTSTVDDRQAINPHYIPLTIATSDGFELQGTLYSSQLPEYSAPKAKSATKKAVKSTTKPSKQTPQPLIVLLHPLSSNRAVWNGVINPLTEKGFAVLTLDMRGHGESVYKGGQLMGWREFDKVDWQRTQRDISAALAELNQHDELAFVKRKRISLMGADIGANLALLFAEDHATGVNAVVALSPGLDNQGLEPEQNLDQLKSPSYYIASSDDTYSAQSTKTLFEGTPSHKKLSMQKGQAHGVDILNNNPNLLNHLIAWLNQYATGTISKDPALADDKTDKPAKKAEKKAAETTSDEPKTVLKKDTPKTDAQKKADLKKAEEAKKAAAAKKAETKPPSVTPKPVRIEPVEAPPPAPAPVAPVAPTPPPTPPQ